MFAWPSDARSSIALSGRAIDFSLLGERKSFEAPHLLRYHVTRDSERDFVTDLLGGQAFGAVKCRDPPSGAMFHRPGHGCYGVGAADRGEVRLHFAKFDAMP